MAVRVWGRVGTVRPPKLSYLSPSDLTNQGYASMPVSCTCESQTPRFRWIPSSRCLDMRIRVRFFQKSTIRVDKITSFWLHHPRNYLALSGKGGGSWEQQSLLAGKIARLYTKPPVWLRLIPFEEWLLLAVYISTTD